MNTTDSETKKLSIAEVISIGVHNYLEAEVPGFIRMSNQEQGNLYTQEVGAAMALGNQDNAEPFQMGNTVFLTLYHPSDQSAMIYFYNADTTGNYTNNIIKFAREINAKRDVKYLVFIGGDRMRSIINRILKMPMARAWEHRILRNKDVPGLYKFILGIGGQRE